MTRIRLTTISGSQYELSEESGCWTFQALAAGGVGTRFFNKAYRIQPPEMPTLMEHFTVHAHPSCEDFPSSGRWVRTSRVRAMEYHLNG